MNSFLITGLPRSRTAWLANFLTYGDSICLHMPEYVKYERIVKFDRYKYTGISCPVTSIDLYPSFQKKLINERDIDEVIPWAEDHLGRSTSVLIEAQKKLDTLSGLRVRYEDIDKNLMNIWDYLIPEVPYNFDRERLLTSLNIQVTNERLKELS